MITYASCEAPVDAVVAAKMISRAKVCVMKKRYEDGIVPAETLAARADIALQLRAARHSVNLTQQNLAELCGTKKSNISRMESGKYNPSLDFLIKVAGSLGMELSIKVG